MGSLPPPIVAYASIYLLKEVRWDRMKKRISAKLAGAILLFSLGLLFLFHLLVLLKVIPADIVWGGQIKGVPSNLVILETAALVITAVFLLITAAKTGYVQAGRLSRLTNFGVWLIFIYLVLNTLGNLASGISFEKLLFAPITIILALCALRLAIEK